LVVDSWSSEGNVEFATISHVWSDGLGNEDHNQIPSCQLRFIASLLKKVSPSPTSSSNTSIIPFWMDTLVIPVYNKKTDVAPCVDFEELKKRAIRQIYHVFHNSNYSIVVDRGLLDIDASGTPWKNVMKILASGWMRRLWTLQEAYLSKRLLIAFRQGEKSHNGMKDFDELVASVTKQGKGTLTSSIAEMARLKLSHNLMGKERDKRKLDENLLSSGGAILVANTWRAARWRVS